MTSHAGGGYGDVWYKLVHANLLGWGLQSLGGEMKINVNPITNITYGLPEYTNIQIVIFDLSGKQIASLINEFQSPGYHSINWNADSHPSGMYFVKMLTGDYINTQKLMLVK